AEHRWVSYLQQVKAKDPAGKLDANANEVKQALEDLNRDPVRGLPDAIYLRGQIYEWTGNMAQAQAEYALGAKQFKANPPEKLRFDSAPLTLELRNAAAVGALFPLPRHLAERQALLAVVLLLQEPANPAAPPEEAGFAFWQAIKASRDKKYSEALKYLE